MLLLLGDFSKNCSETSSDAFETIFVVVSFLLIREGVRVPKTVLGTVLVMMKTVDFCRKSKIAIFDFFDFLMMIMAAMMTVTVIVSVMISTLIEGREGVRVSVSTWGHVTMESGA